MKTKRIKKSPFTAPETHFSFDIPHDLREMTTVQSLEIVAWFATLPLKELRLRQSLCHQQQAMGHEQAQKHGMDTQLELALSNLDITDKQLFSAIWKQTFGDDDETTNAE